MVKENCGLRSAVADAFCIEGKFVGAVPHGHGHINDTFAACFIEDCGNSHKVIFQRINQNVFKEPVRLMDNIEKVTSHLRKKIISEGGDPLRETLNLIPSFDGINYFISDENEFWRAYDFIENACSFQVVENPEHLYNAGIAFGRFQKLLADFPPEQLYETIPDFHNTAKRFTYFVKVIEKKKMNRAAGVSDEIKFVMDRADDARKLIMLKNEGLLPIRVTHNDTKFNNVMIDVNTGKAVCVIDLDTVMPGLVAYDFGDAIRSGTNPAEEDEKDLSKVRMDLELYEQFSRGFLESGQGFLNKFEIEYLPFGAKVMTFECGMRFLTDYLEGDKYFKIHREGHNLDRARTQFKMVEDMEQKSEVMAKIIRKYS